MPLAIIIGTQISSRLVGRVGLAGTADDRAVDQRRRACCLLSRLHSGQQLPAARRACPGAIITFGIGLSFVPVTLSATTGVDRRDAGLASGLINTTRQIGGSLGLAALLTVSTTRATDLTGSAPGVAQTGGYDRAYQVAVVLLLAAAIVAVTLLRKPAPEPELEPSPAVAPAQPAEPGQSVSVTT